MTTRLARFTQKARAEPRERFTALMGLVFDPEGLHASFERQDGKKAPGADGIRKAPLSQADVDAPVWEPDGVTLQVRFCEGPGTSGRMVEILWHRRETRRQQRTPTSTCPTVRNRSTLQVISINGST
jgi:hypothetical protein